MPGPTEVTLGYLPAVSEVLADADIPDSAIIFSPSALRRSSSSADGAPSWPMPSSRRSSIAAAENPFQRASSDGFMEAEPDEQGSSQQPVTAEAAGTVANHHQEAGTFSRTADGGTLLKRFRNSFRSRRRTKDAQPAASPAQPHLDDMDNVPAFERDSAPAASSAHASNLSQAHQYPTQHDDVIIESKKQQPTLSMWGAGELAAARQTFAAVKAALDVEKVEPSAMAPLQGMQAAGVVSACPSWSQAAGAKSAHHKLLPEGAKIGNGHIAMSAGAPTGQGQHAHGDIAAHPLSSN